MPGTSLEVRWLRFCLPVQGVCVLSLVGELRSHMPHSEEEEEEKKKKPTCLIYCPPKTKETF